MKNRVLPIAITIGLAIGGQHIVAQDFSKIQKKTQWELMEEFKDTIINEEDMQQSLDQISQKEFQKHAIQLINKYRYNYKNNGFTQFNLDELQPNDTLNNVAKAYAEYLFQSKWYLKTEDPHIDPEGNDPEDRAEVFGFDADVGECLAFNYKEFDFIEDRIKSLSHNMVLLKYKSKKIGIYRDNKVIVLLISE